MKEKSNMHQLLKTMALSTGMLFVLAATGMAQNQRTWVSNTGSDVPGCGSSPVSGACRTFAGALASTSPGGEIDVLNSGDYGAVVINQAVTIDGGSTTAAITVMANGITVNAGSNDSVVLRNLLIDGTQTGSSTLGIEFEGGLKLTVEHCEVYGFTRRNISIESATQGAIAVIKDSVVRDSLIAGIRVSPPLGIINHLLLDNVLAVNNATIGVAVTGIGSNASITNCIINNNISQGLFVDASAVDLDSSVLSNNGAGILVQDSGTVRMNNSTLVTNVLGFDILNPATTTLFTYGTNRIAGNMSNNGGLTLLALQ
jgi:hypothetical protein